MRGRKMLMNDKGNEQVLRTEIFKHANMNEEVKIDGDNNRWMAHVRELEDMIEQNNKAEVAKRAERDAFERDLHRKKAHDIKPLKTKAYIFSDVAEHE